MASPPPVPIVIVRIQGVDRSKHAPNYRLDFHTNLPNYASETYKGVQREYAEFSRLSQILEASHIGRLIPPLPQGSTSHTEESEDDRLTCMALEKWLSLVANHPIVGLDDQIRAFIEAKVMVRVHEGPLRSASLLTSPTFSMPLHLRKTSLSPPLHGLSQGSRKR